MWGHMGEWGAGWGFVAVGHVLWWLFVIVAVVVLLRWTLGHGPHGRGRGVDPALEVLRERYARGEIDEDEFQARRRVLGG